MLAWGYRHLPYDPATDFNAWGARLIWDEVVAGGRGVVPDRCGWADQGWDVDHPTFLKAFDRFLEAFRGWQKRCFVRPGDDDTFTWEEVVGGFKVEGAASPQQSYGYLYVRLVFKEYK